LLTFLGEARKVSGCRAAPGNPGRPKKEKYQQQQNATIKSTNQQNQAKR